MPAPGAPPDSSARVAGADCTARATGVSLAWTGAPGAPGFDTTAGAPDPADGADETDGVAVGVAEGTPGAPGALPPDGTPGAPDATPGAP